ncbi:hypothetical protein HYU13_00895 [Candidatus Woesearchaeota archaeon]|nr:hypothetical protein [Candidatus Woesearchaeota archaeon]
MADISYLGAAYEVELENMRVMLTHRVTLNNWFCDQEDNVEGLIARLESDLNPFNPRRIHLDKASCQDYRDPFSNVLIPAANELSDQNINQASLLVSLQGFHQNDEKLLFERLCPGIDTYSERAAGKTRYPLIFISEKRFLKAFFEESEITIPNHGGFKRRMVSMKVLKR